MPAKYSGLLIVEGVTLPDPSEMSVTDNDISDSERNANGRLIAQMVREDTHKIECKWALLRPEEYMAIRQAIRKKFGLRVRCFIPDRNGEAELEMYAGDRKTPIYAYEGGMPVYKGFTLNFIEM